MKKFNNFEDAFDFVKDIVKKGVNDSKEAIAEQVYSDSDEFTYRLHGDMYKSGEMHSNFKEGIIIERTPYVRRRYYEGGNAGAGNPKAQPRWFDKTVAKHKSEYKDLVVKSIKKAKKEV